MESKGGALAIYLGRTGILAEGCETNEQQTFLWRKIIFRKVNLEKIADQKESNLALKY